MNSDSPSASRWDPVDQTWDEFRRATVHLTTSNGAVALEPAAIGTKGKYLEGAIGPVHVLTAWNPQGKLVDATHNSTAGRKLAAELAAIKGLSLWPATGTATNGSWHEEGLAVEGLTRDEAIAVALKWDQRAIFEWTNTLDGFGLISCDFCRIERRGWTTRRLRTTNS